MSSLFQSCRGAQGGGSPGEYVARRVRGRERKGWEAGEIKENKVTIILIIAALHKGLRQDAKKGAGAGNTGHGKWEVWTNQSASQPRPKFSVKVIRVSQCFIR